VLLVPATWGKAREERKTITYLLSGAGNRKIVFLCFAFNKRRLPAVSAGLFDGGKQLFFNFYYDNPRLVLLRLKNKK